MEAMGISTLPVAGKITALVFKFMLAPPSVAILLIFNPAGKTNSNLPSVSVPFTTWKRRFKSTSSANTPAIAGLKEGYTGLTVHAMFWARIVVKLPANIRKKNKIFSFINQLFKIIFE
jgi:hypothetical protein